MPDDPTKTGKLQFSQDEISRMRREVEGALGAGDDPDTAPPRPSRSLTETRRERGRDRKRLHSHQSQTGDENELSESAVEGEEDFARPSILFDPGSDEAPFEPPPSERRTRFSDVAKSPYDQLCAESDDLNNLSFQEVDAIKSLKRLWVERGLRENDPAFVLIEALAISEKRARTISRGLANMVRHQADMTEELSRVLRSTAPMLVEHQKFLKAWLTTAPQIVEAQKSLAASCQQIATSTAECISFLSNKSWQAVFLRFVEGVGIILLGFVLGYFFSK